jgi:hypothetical protein
MPDDLRQARAMKGLMMWMDSYIERVVWNVVHSREHGNLAEIYLSEKQFVEMCEESPLQLWRKYRDAK